MIQSFLRTYFKAFLCIIMTLIMSQSNSQQVRFKFKQKAYMIPHPQKVEKGGQDAFYSGQDLIVIADGVGGWNAQGIDPSQYSRFLCSASSGLLQRRPCLLQLKPNVADSQIPIQEQLRRIINNGSANHRRQVPTQLLHRWQKLHLIQDSGFLVIRMFNQKPLLIYQFTEQQHAFNFPYQLAMQRYNGDDPRNSICVSIDIREADIIVAGSDGLFDNIFVDEILATVEDALRTRPDDVFELPKLFSQQAIRRGQNLTFSSPFSQRANELGIRFQGGKLDDTTVIVARIETWKIQKKQQMQEM